MDSMLQRIQQWNICFNTAILQRLHKHKIFALCDGRACTMPERITLILNPPVFTSRAPIFLITLSSNHESFENLITPSSNHECSENFWLLFPVIKNDLKIWLLFPVITNFLKIWVLFPAIMNVLKIWFLSSNHECFENVITPSSNHEYQQRQLKESWWVAVAKSMTTQSVNKVLLLLPPWFDMQYRQI